MSDTYDDHLLEARDVCANCLRLVRTERIDPARRGVAREYEQRLERHPQTTTIEYAPADRVADQKGVFCECGVEDHRVQDRIWSDEDVDDGRFKQLIKSMLRTLTEKGVTIDRQTAAGHALQARRNGADVDEALSTGVDVGLARAITLSDEDENSQAKLIA